MQANHILFKTSPMKQRAKEKFAEAIEQHFQDEYGVVCLVEHENEWFDLWDLHFEQCELDFDKTHQFIKDHCGKEALSFPHAQIHPFKVIKTDKRKPKEKPAVTKSNHISFTIPNGDKTLTSEFIENVIDMLDFFYSPKAKSKVVEQEKSTTVSLLLNRRVHLDANFVKEEIIKQYKGLLGTRDVTNIDFTHSKEKIHLI